MKKILLLATALFMIAQFASAEETFYTSLESKRSVEDEGGTVNGGEFVPGALGNGFMSIDPTDTITFPVEGRFTNLKEGTFEVFVTLEADTSGFTGNKWMFITYKRGTDALDIYWGDSVPHARIKSGGTWYTASADPPPNWKAGETHHMAHTWGPDGLHLYLDGELAGSDPFTGGPLLFSTWIAINNVEPAAANFPSGYVVDEFRIFDHQKEVDELVTNPYISVEPAEKMATTWGRLKDL